MTYIIAILSTFYALTVFAVPCDCRVSVFSPMTGSHKLPPYELKSYELADYDSYSSKAQNQCRNSCEKRFQDDMSVERINVLLVLHSQKLIEEGVLGYNCTGLTTLKYPVRVKASLGQLSLGNVADDIYVITHEQVCF